MSRYLSKSVFRLQALRTRTRPALVAAYDPLQYYFDTFKRLNSNSSAPKNSYTTLGGLPPKASIDDDVSKKKSFLQLAKKYHPDVNKSPDANSKFIEVCQAAKEAIEDFDTTVSERDKAAGDQKWSRQFTRPAFHAAERAAEERNQEILRVERERDRKQAERGEEFQRIRAESRIEKKNWKEYGRIEKKNWKEYGRIEKKNWKEYGSRETENRRREKKNSKEYGRREKKNWKEYGRRDKEIWKVLMELISPTTCIVVVLMLMMVSSIHSWMGLL